MIKNRDILYSILFFGLLKGLDILFPFVMLTLLVSTLGVQDYGYYALLTTIVALERLVVNFGFDWSASKRILGVIYNNQDESSRIFYSIAISKIIILLVILFFLLVVVLFFFRDTDHVMLLLIFSCSLLGEEILYSAWFYIAMQHGKQLLFFKTIHRILLITFFFLLSKKQGDVLSLIIYLEILFSLLFGSVSFLFIIRKFNLKYQGIDYKGIVNSLKSSAYIFLSNTLVYMYSSFNTLMIGVLLGSYYVGIYSICEKIYQAGRVLCEPIILAFYPYLLKLYSEDIRNFFDVCNKLILGLFCLLAIISFCIFNFIDNILVLVVKDSGDLIQFKEIMILFLMALPLALGGLFSKFLVIHDRTKWLFNLSFVTMLINLLISPLMIVNFEIKGAVLSFLVVQLFQLIVQINFYIKERRNLIC